MVNAHQSIGAQLTRRRVATGRCEPLPGGYRDPITRLARESRRRPRTVLSLSASLAALRRAWILAEPGDRDTLQAIADYLKEVAA